MAGLYLLVEKYETTRVRKHWEEVCRTTLARRNSLKHKVLRGDADMQAVGVHGLGVACLCDTSPLATIMWCWQLLQRTCRG